MKTALTLEGIVTTINADEDLNVAPMGPIMQPGADEFELRPFDTSRTYQNLLYNPAGVLHVTDDVLLFAKAATRKLAVAPDSRPATHCKGRILSDCCYSMEFTATHIHTDESRKLFRCQIIARHSVRPFFGFNRAKNSVIEATILATRVHLLPTAQILQQFEQLKPVIAKTGGVAEHDAFSLLEDYVQLYPNALD